jgi:hypothetical protein
VDVLYCKTGLTQDTTNCPIDSTLRGKTGLLVRRRMLSKINWYKRSHDLIFIQLVGFIDPRPLKMHQNLLTEGQSTIFNIPKAFTSIDEAQIYLALIQRRNSRLIVVFAAHTAKNRKFRTTSLNLGFIVALVLFYPESHFSASITEPRHPNF